MRTQPKIIITIGLAWLLFLCLLYAASVIFLTPKFLALKNIHLYIHYFIISTIFLATIFGAFILGCMYFMLVKRIEKLDVEITSLNSSKGHNQYIPEIRGNDEISHITSQINNMLNFIEQPQRQASTSLKERLNELESMNAKLQQEINKKNAAEREFIIHKERLVRLAHYDSLTSLPNRVFFNELLNKAINHAKRHEQILAILIVDIDQFKSINDKHGKHVGNIVLKEFSQRFSGILRSGDVVARLGGDEFIVLLNDIENPNFAGPVAEKILLACKQAIKVEDHIIVCKASIGVSVFPNDGESLEELQKHADLALYKAKRVGGGIYQYYRHDMDIAAHEHIKLETSLRNAIQNKEFVLYYQPLLNLKTGTIKAVEALIRWEHPELGLLAPAKFIPFAEESGLIMKIGEWVIHEVCRTNKAWQNAGYEPLTTSVNVSPKQFYNQDVAQIIADALKETELDPSCLVVEITETVMMENIDLTIPILNKIKDMGVLICIDDYGIGYTSINYLKQFPVSILKIDQSFIKGIPYNQNDAAIVSSIISLGHNLGMKVIAEGVESTDQIRYLAELNCDLIQGYFLSRPLPEGKIILQFAKKKKKEKHS